MASVLCPSRPKIQRPVDISACGCRSTGGEHEKKRNRELCALPPPGALMARLPPLRSTGPRGLMCCGHGAGGPDDAASQTDSRRTSHRKL